MNESDGTKLAESIKVCIDGFTGQYPKPWNYHLSEAMAAAAIAVFDAWMKSTPFEGTKYEH